MKLVCVFTNKDQSVFYDLDEERVYYRKAVDTKSVGFIIPFMLLYFLFVQINKKFEDNFLNGNYLLWFIISNIISIIIYIMIQGNDRKQMRPYYPYNLEFYNNLDKVKQNLYVLIIAFAVCSALTLLFSFLYFRTKEFIMLLLECASFLFVLSCVFYNGLIYKKKLIRMIENQEIP